MVSKTFNRYIWLLNTLLQKGKLTFEEISKLWQESGMGDEKPMPLRTFHQHRKAVEELDEVSRKSASSYNAFYPFSKKLIIMYPESERYLSQDIHVHVEYNPVYKKYDEVVVETTLKMWEDGELRNENRQK
jgi:hypothetical protein